MCGRREEVNPFAYYLARSEVFRNNAIQNMVGSSGRQRVPSDAVSGFTLPLPPEEILVKFGLLATYLMRKIRANADQLAILTKIRDALKQYSLTSLSEELAAITHLATASGHNLELYVNPDLNSNSPTAKALKAHQINGDYLGKVLIHWNTSIFWEKMAFLF
jgi:restriction endonuclease S subunit